MVFLLTGLRHEDFQVLEAFCGRIKTKVPFLALAILLEHREVVIARFSQRKNKSEYVFGNFSKSSSEGTELEKLAQFIQVALHFHPHLYIAKETVIG